MQLQPGDPVPLDQLIHPRIEPEIVFIMKDRLEGPGVTAAQALAAVDRVYAGAEVIDSRYRDFKFLAGDVVADNASSGAYVVATSGLAPDELDLIAEPVELEVDGEVVDQATGAAVLGDPALALAVGANELANRGLAIEAGWVVLTGGLTDAVFANKGSTVACRFATLGDVELFCGPVDN
jgi:2-oxo-3-hexenedioate decarboxylase